MIASDDTARMEWKLYWRNVVRRYQVIIEGWPDNIPFRNLSEASSPLHDLDNLLCRWRGGKTYWRKLSDAEFHDLDLKRNAQIENGELAAPAPRRRRSDHGKKRLRARDGTDTQRKRYKYSKEVEDTDNSSGEEHQSPTTSGISREQSPRASQEAIPQAAPSTAAVPSPAPAMSTAAAPIPPVPHTAESPSISTVPGPSTSGAPSAAATATVPSGTAVQTIPIDPALLPVVPHAAETSIAATTAAAPSVAPATTWQLSSMPPAIPTIPIDPTLL